MQIGFSGLTYVPTIYLRPAELSAIEHLSNSDKDLILPIFLLRPWATAKTLDKAMAKIESSFSGRKYFLVCDPSYAKDGEATAASMEFSTLCSGDEDCAAWWEFVHKWPNAIPAVPLSNDPITFRKNVARASELERGFIIRVHRTSGMLSATIVDALHEVEHNEYVVCLDVGWGRDILGAQMWADGFVKALVGHNDQIRIVVSGSSFPREFSKFGTFGEESSLERILHANLVQQNNQANLIYGDWGSSRSSMSQGGGVIIPRIDIPRQRSWYIFRAQNEFGSYQATAKEALDSQKWEYEPDVWGKYVIRNTSLGQGYVIDSPKKSTEARINIHLHQQISGNTPPNGQFIEEDFVD